MNGEKMCTSQSTFLDLQQNELRWGTWSLWDKKILSTLDLWNNTYLVL